MKRVKTISNTGLKIMPNSKENIFLELHKLDYEKRRINIRLEAMRADEESMLNRLSIINQGISEMLETVKTAPTTTKGKSTKRLKY